MLRQQPPALKWGVTMPVRRYRKDPRGTAERRADKAVLGLFGRRGLLKTDPAMEREAASRDQARGETVTPRGKESGRLRSLAG